MSCHDVRKLRRCDHCGMLAEVTIAGRHPVCMTPDALLAQPIEDLRRVRICDVPESTMRKILDRLEAEEA